MYGGSFTSVCACRGQRSILASFLVILYLIFEPGSLTELELVISARLTGYPKCVGSSCLCLLAQSATLDSYVGPEHFNSGLMLVW